MYPPERRAASLQRRRREVAFDRCTRLLTASMPDDLLHCVVLLLGSADVRAATALEVADADVSVTLVARVEKPEN